MKTVARCYFSVHAIFKKKDRPGVNSINAHKNIFMNLHKYECRLIS